MASRETNERDEKSKQNDEASAENSDNNPASTSDKNDDRKEKPLGTSDTSTKNTDSNIGSSSNSDKKNKQNNKASSVTPDNDKPTESDKNADQKPEQMNPKDTEKSKSTDKQGEVIVETEKNGSSNTKEPDRNKKKALQKAQTTFFQKIIKCPILCPLVGNILIIVVLITLSNFQFLRIWFWEHPRITTGLILIFTALMVALLLFQKVLAFAKTFIVPQKPFWFIAIMPWFFTLILTYYWFEDEIIWLRLYFWMLSSYLVIYSLFYICKKFDIQLGPGTSNKNGGNNVATDVVSGLIILFILNSFILMGWENGIKGIFFPIKYYFEVKPYSTDFAEPSIPLEALEVHLDFGDKESTNNDDDNDRVRVASSGGYYLEIDDFSRHHVIGIKNNLSQRDTKQYWKEYERFDSTETKWKLYHGRKRIPNDSTFFHRLINNEKKKKELFLTTRKTKEDDQNLIIIVESQIKKTNPELRKFDVNNIMTGRLEENLLKSLNGNVAIDSLTTNARNYFQENYNIIFPTFALNNFMLQNNEHFAINLKKLAKMTRSMAIAAPCVGVENNTLQTMFLIDEDISESKYLNTKLFRFLIETKIEISKGEQVVENAIKACVEKSAAPIITYYYQAVTNDSNKVIQREYLQKMMEILRNNSEKKFLNIEFSEDSLTRGELTLVASTFKQGLRMADSLYNNLFSKLVHIQEFDSLCNYFDSERLSKNTQIGTLVDILIIASRKDRKWFQNIFSFLDDTTKVNSMSDYYNYSKYTYEIEAARIFYESDSLQNLYRKNYWNRVKTGNLPFDPQLYLELCVTLDPKSNEIYDYKADFDSLLNVRDDYYRHIEDLGFPQLEEINWNNLTREPESVQKVINPLLSNHQKIQKLFEDRTNPDSVKIDSVEKLVTNSNLYMLEKFLIDYYNPDRTRGNTSKWIKYLNLDYSSQ